MAIDAQLRIDATHKRGTSVLRLRGELDLASAPLLEGELETREVAASTALVLDLQELQFVDSTGLRAILAAHERAQERGQEFAVTRGSDQVERLLAITRVRDHLRVVDSSDEAAVTEPPS